MPDSRGLSLIELLTGLTLTGLALAAVVPAFAELGAAGRVAAGAREMAMTFHALRWKAAARHRSHGLLFERQGESWVWREVADGNGNGLRTAEVRAGTDPTLAGPFRMEARVRGVRLGLLPGEGIPRIPPRGGVLDDADDPVRFGRSDLVSFSPLGSASSGTLFLTDGKNELYGVVLFGPTSRVRVWRYDRRVGEWKL